MDNHSATPLWDRNTELPQLRRPCISVAENSSVTNSSSSVSDVAKKSNLSVEAKEWYPPGYQSASSGEIYPALRNSSVQNRLRKYRQPENARTDNVFDGELGYLQEIIDTLTHKPGKFDELICGLMEHLEPHFDNIEVISRVTSAIFEQALTVSNFQYSGVRLLAVLDETCPFVRACLHSLCEKELEKTQNLKNAALLFAEIYAKLNYELFGKCLLKALKTLTTSPDNTKCICQTLKLCGAKLEKLDPSLVSEILTRLDTLRPELLQSQSLMVESVLALRDSQWGQADLQGDVPTVPAQHPPAEPPAEPYEWTDGPVFYGPDGIQLTTEESEFLAENLNDFIIDDSDPDALWNPEPEMNEEIQAAFAEFVRSNTR